MEMKVSDLPLGESYGAKETADLVGLVLRRKSQDMN